MFRAVLFASAIAMLGCGSAARPDKDVDNYVVCFEKWGGELARDDTAPGKPVGTAYRCHTQVMGAGFKELTALKSLQFLSLRNTQVTEKGLKEVNMALPKCEAHSNAAEDEAVAFVERLGGSITRDDTAPGKPVVEVDLHGTQVTDDGLKELVALKSLTTLDLSFTHVTDAGLKELVALNCLTELFLCNTKVTGTGLKDLVALKSLTTLHLKRTQVTYAGVKELVALKNLAFLQLTFTKVTDAGVKELRRALPKCAISK